MGCPFPLRARNYFSDYQRQKNAVRAETIRLAQEQHNDGFDFLSYRYLQKLQR